MQFFSDFSQCLKIGGAEADLWVLSEGLISAFLFNSQVPGDLYCSDSTHKLTHFMNWDTDFGKFCYFSLFFKSTKKCPKIAKSYTYELHVQLGCFRNFAHANYVWVKFTLQKFVNLFLRLCGIHIVFRHFYFIVIE